MSQSISRRALMSGAFSAAGAFPAVLSAAEMNSRVNRSLAPGKTPIRLALSTMRIQYPKDGNMDGLVKRIRDSGYTSATTVSTRDARNPLLGASDSEIVALKAALAKYDVVIFDVMTWCNPIHPDPKTREQFRRYLIESIQTAERIGAPMITSVTGSCNPDFYNGIHRDNWSAETWKTTVQYFRDLLRDTAGMKTALGMEATVTTNLDGVEAHLRLKNDLNGDPRLKVCLDPTNMLSLQNYYHTTELLHECFDRLGEDILGCHAKDAYILPDKMYCYVTEVAPGKGVMDYETYLVLMSRMKWTRSLFIEHLPDEEYPGAKDFILKSAAKAGVKIYGEG